MKKIAIVSAYQKSFIDQDIKALSSYFQVKNLYLPQKNMANIAKLFITVKNSDLVVAWFADFWAMITVFFATILGKKSLVVVGGYELAAIPELNYGGLLQKRTKTFVKYILKNANRVLFVDKSLKKEAISKFNLNRDAFLVVPTGIDTSFFVPAGTKENMVLTVAACHTTETAILKGLDKFADVAKMFSEQHFCIVGAEDEAAEWLQNREVENLQIVGKLSAAELLKYYQKATVYCQLSMREGLPNALCEAMLCGCTPVGSNVNGVPTAIDDTGIICPDRELVSISNCIKAALKIGSSPEPRLRISNNFSLKLRKQRLQQIIEELV
jgi:glycosyltransferase involved in cell wall biosynthesis